VKELVLQAPAKINLCLSVLGKRPDGYHEVDMVMQAVGLFDTVTVRRDGFGVSVSCSAAGVPAGEGNIAGRAARAMLERAGGRGGVSIFIAKNIPVAAGLGGGSSDAAAVLAACNRLLGLGLGRDELCAIGATLGMDVPFFFHGPTARATGRGEVLTRLRPPDRFWTLLVNPGFETSTAWVYKNLNFGLTKKVDCTNIPSLPAGKIAEMLHNDLETVTAAAHREIGEMERALMAEGALGARMSGSGPTVFGVFDTADSCRRAAKALARTGWGLFPTETLTSPLFEDLLGPGR
jgi:4-diphosphocytidyl-2-C-methyl-D-erythritol kinase